MASSPLTIWSDASFPADITDHLQRAAAPHRLVFAATPSASNPVAGPHDPGLAGADVAFGQPDPKQVMATPRVRWVHVTSAGYTRYDTDAFRQSVRDRGGAFTNSSSVYDDPCAQHVLAMMLGLARQLPQCLDDQRGDRRWLAGPARTGAYLLSGQSALVYGYGSIARRLVELLGPFRMNVTGVRRSPKGDEPVPMTTPDGADALLAKADHVVNVLPLSDATANFFDARRLGLLSPTARFYNVGRGGTVDQAALTAALSDHKVAAAYLDVTTPEPLPAADPLWSLPNCWVTPHSAGGHADEPRRLADHFLANLRRFAAGEPLRDRIV